MNELAFFETDDGSIEVRVEQETVWLSQDQMARIFERERSVITKHLRNVFRDGELAEEAVCANFAHTAADGKTYQTKFFNLDAILSVGYRVNSKRGIHFRQWATRVLKEHLTRGYTLDRQRLEHNARELEAALLLVRRTLSNAELAHDAGSGLAEIVVRYTQTFLWLQRYDEGLLTDPRGHPGGALPAVGEARAGIATLKADLVAKGQASALFGNERDDGLAALLGNLDQTVFGADGSPVVNDVGLAALSLLVAQSRPDEKDVLIRLIMNMLAGEAA